MILTQEEINKLGEQLGLMVPNAFDNQPHWYNDNPTEIIRAAEKLILEKLDDSMKRFNS